MTTVTRIERHTGWRSSGNSQYDYQYAGLACGHAHSEVWDTGETPKAEVGQEVECIYCARNAEAREVTRAAHDAGKLSHTRSSRVSRNTIDAYQYDQDSPTGVRHLASLEDSPETYAFLRTLSAGFSPLSPTEAR